MPFSIEKEPKKEAIFLIEAQTAIAPHGRTTRRQLRRYHREVLKNLERLGLTWEEMRGTIEKSQGVPVAWREDGCEPVKLRLQISLLEALDSLEARRGQERIVWQTSFYPKRHGESLFRLRCGGRFPKRRLRTRM